MEAKNINISEWTLTGGGAQGDSYNNNADPSIMLKLFTEGYDISSIEAELKISQAIYENDIPVPKPGHLATFGKRYGLIFQRIPNKKSFCRAIADDASCSADMARRFATMGRELHATECRDERFPDIIDFYRQLYSKASWLDDRIRKAMDISFDIVEKQKSHTFCHGDYHFGNVITDGKNDYFIDLGCFGYGHQDFDNSMMFCVATMCPKELIEHNYHITLGQAEQFWEEYKVFYYGENAPSNEDLLIRYAPYLMLRMLFYVDVCGPIPPILEITERVIKALNC